MALSDSLDLFVVRSGADHDLSEDFECGEIPTCPCQPAFERRLCEFSNRTLSSEGMDEESIRDFTADFGHSGADAGQKNRWVSVGMRAGIEDGRHQRVL